MLQEKAPVGGFDVPLVSYTLNKKIGNFVLYLSAILAAFLLLGAILILYDSKSNNVKLSLIGLFTFPLRRKYWLNNEHKEVRGILLRRQRKLS